MSTYHHGAEVVNTGGFPSSVTEVETSTICIVGTGNIAALDAELQTVNTPVLLRNYADAVKYFGPHAAGFSLPEALEYLYLQFGKVKPAVIAINVFDPATHTGGVSDVTATVVKGGLVDGKRTGIFAISDAQPVTGKKPKILIAPGFSADPAVQAQLSALAEELKAVYYVDVPASKTTAEVLAARATDSEDALNFSDKRGTICYPSVKVPDDDSTKLVNYSVFAAALRAKTDIEDGFWHSISSRTVRGGIGAATPISYAIDNPDTDANKLNGAGVLTVKNVGGLRTTGNKNSSFPTNTGMDNAENIVRICDVIEESIAKASEEDIDKPFTDAWVRGILRKVRNFMNNLKGKGVIANFSLRYDPPAKNEADENPTSNTREKLSRGHVVFAIDDCPTPVVDRITYQRSINLDYLSEIGGE